MSGRFPWYIDGMYHQFGCVCVCVCSVFTRTRESSSTFHPCKYTPLEFSILFIEAFCMYSWVDRGVEETQCEQIIIKSNTIRTQRCWPFMRLLFPFSVDARMYEVWYEVSVSARLGRIAVQSMKLQTTRHEHEMCRFAPPLFRIVFVFSLNPVMLVWDLYPKSWRFSGCYFSLVRVELALSMGGKYSVITKGNI